MSGPDLCLCIVKKKILGKTIDFDKSIHKSFVNKSLLMLSNAKFGGMNIIVSNFKVIDGVKNINVIISII